jgi:hypothetical protein
MVYTYLTVKIQMGQYLLHRGGVAHTALIRYLLSNKKNIFETQVPQGIGHNQQRLT